MNRQFKVHKNINDCIKYKFDFSVCNTITKANF